MKRNGWASLALASSLLWASGCCCDGCDGCSGGHHSGGLFSRGAGYAQTPCACGNGNASGLTTGPTLANGQFITSEGPQMTSPMIMPGANGPGYPPRIIPVPQANPIPYTP